MIASLAALVLLQAGAQAPDARLQELVDIRAFARILGEFLPRVRPGGDLEHDGRAIAHVARAAVSSGALEEARNLLAQAEPKTAGQRVAIERARLSLADDRLEEASRALLSEDERGTRMRYPEDPAAWILFARARARLQDYESADRAARGFLRLAPRAPEAPTAWQIRADHALRRNDAPSARAFLLEAEKLRRWHELLIARRLQRMRTPRAELPQLGLALLWMEAKEYERAREILLDLTGRTASFCRGWFHLGETERLLADASAAERAYDRSLACDSKHPPTRANRAALRMAREDWKGARDDYAALLSGETARDVRYLEAHLAWARALLRSGERAEADLRYDAYRAMGGEGELE